MYVNYEYIWKESLSSSEINLLYNTVGWPQFPEEQLSLSFKCTWNWLSCRSSDGQLVGFSRILSDGMIHAYICSMVVHSKFQNLGIGTLMMNKIIELCSDNNMKPVLKVKTEEKIIHFYNKLGFKIEKNGAYALVS
jgi:ribosomal protein S18 acetylase RimI-like enzyme